MSDNRSADTDAEQERLQQFLVAAADFKASPRYSILKQLLPVNLLGPAAFPSQLCGLTIEQLLEIGPAALMELGAESLNALAALLDNFAKGSDAVSFDAALVCPPELAPGEEDFGGRIEEELPGHLFIGKEAAGARALPRLNSIEAENLLRNAFDRLRSQPFFDRIAPLRLCRFWGGEWMREPFIESMTFKQLMEMKLSNLLEKRSFTSWKVTAIVDAIRRCIAEQGGSWEEIEEPAAPASPAPSRCTGQLRWRTGQSAGSVLALAVLTQFELQWRIAVDLHADAARLICALPDALSADEYAAWWLLSLCEIGCAARLLEIEESSVMNLRDTARSRILSLIPAAAPALHGHWQAALAGPGSDFQALSEAHMSVELDLRYQRQFLKALLSCCAARHPSVWDIVVEQYWTKNEKLLQLSLEAVLQMMPLAEDRLTEELQSLLPLY